MFRRSSTLRFVLLAVCFFIGADVILAEDSPPQAEQGVLDLRGYDFLEDGLLQLQGEWGFDWDEGISELDIQRLWTRRPEYFVHVPEYWDVLAQDHVEVTRRGVAIYRLRVLLPPGARNLALKSRNIPPNGRVFFDGRLIEEIGQVGLTPRESVAGSHVLLVPVADEDGILDISIAISNFHNNKSGLNRPLVMGDFQDVRRFREQAMAMDAVFLGGLFLMALYQLAMFFLDRSRRAPLYMAILCVLVIFFAGLKNEMTLLAIFPELSGEWRAKLIYLALILAGPAFTLYAYSLYPQYFGVRSHVLLFPVPIVFAVVVLVAPMSVFTHYLFVMEAFTLAAAIYVIVSLVVGYVKNRDGRLLYYLGGIAFLLASILFGMLDNEVFVAFQSVAGVFFLFALYQAFLQATIYSHTVNENASLVVAKSDLEKRNVELFSMSYIDSLTGTCNRRLMDDYLVSHWRVNALSDKKLGLILIDIDDFKRYNDIYGHRMGDRCLVRICDALRDALARMGGENLSRYGGEEFAVIVSDADPMTLYRLAEEMRIEVENTGIEHRGSRAAPIVTISLGCASLIPSAESVPETLLDAADRALYRAKNSGRNRTEIYLPEEEDHSGIVAFGPRAVD